MLKESINRIVQGLDLTEREMEDAVEHIAEGRATDAQIGAFLAALRMKGETVGEIAGAARVMREKSARIPVTRGPDEDEILVDTCGTGGDGAGTFNVSSTTAFVVAGAGLRVAKHGNRAMSSQCGSADVMEALGVNLELSPDQVGQCIDRVGIGFLFAPALHAAMRHVIGPRRELAVRTIFNVLGPLTNPARANVQALGVYHPDLTETMARVLGRMGCRGACVVHGLDGLDEISIAGPSRVSRLHDGRVDTFTITPEELGLRRADLSEVKGGDPRENAAITRSVLQGRPGPHRGHGVDERRRGLCRGRGVRGFPGGGGSGRRRYRLRKGAGETRPAEGAQHGVGVRSKGGGVVMAESVLDRILARKQQDVAALRGGTDPAALRRKALEAGPPRDFASAVAVRDRVTVIAEIKKASPSAGLLRGDVDVRALARDYQSAGAAAISVLTDSHFFKGSLEDLERVREAVDIPVLRKDFIIDPVQVYEARGAGADAVLLIAAALDPERLKRLLDLTHELGMAALIEVHNEAELDAVLGLNPGIVGINNRNLTTLEVSLDTSLTLRPGIPAGVTVVCESGIRGPEDIRMLRQNGLDAFLIGTTPDEIGGPEGNLVRIVPGGGLNPWCG